MEDNPIMQRVMMLSELWKTEVENSPAVTFFSWLGSSLVEFKTIKGFTIYQTSYEKSIADTVFMLEQAFDQDNIAAYNHSILQILHQSIQAMNADEKACALLRGPITWSFEGGEQVDTAFLLVKLNALATALAETGSAERLVLALYPRYISNHQLFADWVRAILEQTIVPELKFMLYDSVDVAMFEGISSTHPEKFKYLHADLDIAGAMHAILEQGKSSGKTEEENDTISFQQALIKLTEAIGYAKEREIKFYQDLCFQYTQKHGWLHMEALVHFYMHGYYSSLKKHQEAISQIDEAIEKVDKAHANGVQGTKDMQYQYRIAKGNSYFMRKANKEAIAAYHSCIALPMDPQVNPILFVGIYQMLGNALRQDSRKQESFEAFVEGWSWMEQLGEDNLKDNMMAMFYAKDMLEVARGEHYKGYSSQFESWWGKDWKRQLEAKSYLQSKK